MSYFLRELIQRDGSSLSSSSSPSSTVISEGYATLIRKCHRRPFKGDPLTIPLSKGSADDHQRNTDRLRVVRGEIEGALHVVGAPSSFATVAIARALLTKYGSILQEQDHAVEPETSNNTHERVEETNSGKADQLICAGVSSVFDILRLLSKRDSELCVQALTSLLTLIQNMPVDSLRNEPKSSVESMMKVLKQLREEGSPSVCARASSCLAALAIASGQPDQLIPAVQSLICTQRMENRSTDSSYDMIQIPENLHRLNLRVLQKIYQGQDTANTWCNRPLDEHRLMCSFDLPRLPSDSPNDTPDDDMRLNGAIASDGAYIYVLNYVGLYKLGTGLQETIMGKLYASNQGMRATKHCMLTFCNSSLYLRRGQSSCISVIDTDSLIDIGEVMLTASSSQCALFSDGTSFYHASVNHQSNLSLTVLNDSFVPCGETQSKKKIRLTDISYSCLGERRPVPHQLPLNMPAVFHAQAVDLHLNSDCAFFQARSGKVYYAGNGTKFGLQEVGTTWMEMLLPEPITQMSVGNDVILLKSASGHVWIASIDDKRKAAKIRRLNTANRRKAISIACSANNFAYVTDNGRVYSGGPSTSRNTEAGLILGLEGVQIATVALGKSHTVCISRQGHLYTWGMNNLHQCGRVVHPPTKSSSPKKVTVCEMGEHFFVKDVPSLCNQCGLCSARGASCPRSHQNRTGFCLCGPGETNCLRCGLCRQCCEPSNSPPVATTDSLTPTRSIASPARILLVKGKQDVKVASVSCGNFHTVVLAADRRVFSFGSNCHGQLGVGDTKSKVEPQLVLLPTDLQIVQVAAGSNHCVLRTTDGAVYTFGAHKAGQLARPSTDNPSWHAIPGRVPGFGPGFPSFASWIGAFGDSTIIHSHKSLLTNDDIMDSQIVASKNDVFIFPRQVGREYVAIRRKPQSFAHHQLGPSGLYTSWTLEPSFDLLWSYNAAEMRVQAHSAHLKSDYEESEDPLEDLSFMRGPELALPLDCPAHFSSIQAGISILSCTYAASTMSKSPFWADKTFSSAPTVTVSSSPDTYSVCSRFESIGGGWGYSAHSVEAIQFKSSKDIRLMGIGLYGGRGEYVAKIKLSRLLGAEADELFIEHVTETDETLYDCPARETAVLMLSQPVSVRANQWHVISVKISGPSSDCGSSGRDEVSYDQITFNFRNSVCSNNGTDIGVGQIPELYYQIDNSDDAAEINDGDKNAQLISLSRMFSSASLDCVSPSVFSSLLCILDWSLIRVFDKKGEGDEKQWFIERASIVALMTMRLLSRYILLVFPSGGSQDEPHEYVSVMAQLHTNILKLFALGKDEDQADSFAIRCVLRESVRLFVCVSSCLLSSRQSIRAHMSSIMTEPVGDILQAAVLGSIAKKDQLLNIFLHNRYLDVYPDLSSIIIKQLDISMEKIDTLTSMANILRFLYDRSFATATNSCQDVPKMAQDIVVKLAKELSIPDIHHTLGATKEHSNPRFRRRSSQSNWEMIDGAADAIAFRIEGDGIILHGVAVYICPEEEKRIWNCQIYALKPDSLDDWDVLSETVCEMKETAGSEYGIIPLPTGVNISCGVLYAIKVSSPANGKTYCGDSGISSIRLTNGTKIHFSSCALSENGTNLLRGQIPFIVYTIHPNKISIVDTEENHRCFLMLLRLLSNKIATCLTEGEIPSCARSLISRISGCIMVFMERYPEKTIEIMATLEQLIPMVSSVNGAMKASTLSESLSHPSEVCETKTHQVVVESKHPYSANQVYSMVVGFDQSVDFMCIQFSSSCETAQADDQLFLYLGVDRQCYVPVGKYFGSRDWPTRPLLLPGNSLWFVLEATAEVEGVAVDQMYGFHCTITGYPSSSRDSNLRLEQELTWLSASACRILVQLPCDPSALAHLSIAEDDTRIMLEKHGGLLKKGLNLSHSPTLNEIITKGLPPAAQTPDLLFVREFISCSSSSMAGFLSRWLPTGPVVDPFKCQLSIGQADMVVGKPVMLRVTTKDQFDRQVQCPSMNVEVIVQTGGGSNKKINKINRESLPSMQLMEQHPYQQVIINRSRYMSISTMPVYANYSYEELRLGFYTEAAFRETIQLKHKSNSTFQAEWTPSTAGSFKVECRVDGFELSHTYTIQVTDRENGALDRNKKDMGRTAQLSRARIATIPPTADFQGVRMRTSTSLVAQCIGIIPRGGTFSYIEEIDNDDGKWVRLTDESALLFGYGCTTGQVWCLAYHNLLHRELIPIGSETGRDRKAIKRQEGTNPAPVVATQASVLIHTDEMYILEPGQRMQLYSQPSPDGLIPGEEMEGRREVMSDGWVNNQYGVWIRIAGTKRYLLAENSVGRSSIHSQSYSTNGNEEEEGSPPPRQQTNSMSIAMRPSVADCCRVVFAAFLWHEHLVKDAMAAAAYLKFHQHLHNLWSSDMAPSSLAPSALQPLIRLWKEVVAAVQTSVEQHLIMPPSIGKALHHVESRKKETAHNGCELCEDSFKVPITVHMRMTHQGCGEDSQGYGYNSCGKFTTGWSGNCGTGGRAGSTWYLLCPICRSKFMRKTPAGHRQERTKRWREFRLSTTAFDARPEVIIKQNALFLLDLNSSLECDSKSSSAATSGWTINLFPTQTPSPSTMPSSAMFGRKLDTSHFAKSSFMSHSMSKAAHASDPGPKGPPPFSPPSVVFGGPASSLGGRSHQSTHEPTSDCQEVLQSPSAALRTLITHSTTPSTTAMLKRPVLAFVVEHHNLKRIRDACEQSVRRAVGFSHAFRVWNWLLRLVSSETSVSDVIFQYLTALSSYHRLGEYYHTQDHHIKVLPHPWRLCFLAGPIAGKMVQQLHALLYTIAVILQSSGVDGRLRSLCFKAWTIQLTAHEQELLILTCNMLATVGGVLSEPSTSGTWILDSADRSKQPIKTDMVDVKEMRDITCLYRLEASSRQAMVVCLTDGSPDTFWESGDEDKNRSRVISVSVISEKDGTSPVLLCVFVDNIRDDNYRTSTITVRAALSDGSRKELSVQNIEPNFSGWIKCCIAGVKHMQLVIKGPQNSSRIRQLSILGFCSNAPPEVMKPSTSHQLFFNNTQIDAFALFQAIAAQAFSSELSEEQHGTLRERVVDLLFSRVQLQPLQNYVSTQVVNALEREVSLLCDQSKKNYSYVCGLLEMLVRICESRKGVESFAPRNNILIAISELLIFAPQVVQCQVISSIERLLYIFSPETVDVSRFLKNILIVIGKVITLQVRDKAAHTVTTAVMNGCLVAAPSSWRLDRSISTEIGKLTTQLIGSICDGQFSPEWAVCIQRELANSLLGVVQLSTSLSSTSSRDNINREPMPSILTSKRFWISVSALALVKDKAWLEMTDKWMAMEAARGEEPDVLCENHDDGHTFAQVYCTVCETALCRECFTVMHLHKKNRSHQVQTLGHPARSSEIDVHQGCARMRVANLLILFHGVTLNGMVELSSDPLFRSATSSLPFTSMMPSVLFSGRCRFCGNSIDVAKQIIPNVCSHPDCIRLSESACQQNLQCGHPCGGIASEVACLPCLTCHVEGNQQDGDDLCVVCFTDRLGAAPCVQLECGHLFHYHCLRTILERRWNGPRINFRCINCPLCNQQISHPGLSDLLDPIIELKNDVIQKARMRLEYDGLLTSAAITDPKSEYYNRTEDYAMDRYMYVLCCKCNKAYFGGESRCQVALDSSQYNPAELMCGGCSDVTGAQVCGRHGAEFLEFKCRFCCSIAVYFCFGNTHFCASCHDDFQRLMCLPKTLLPKCPAGPRGIQMEEGPCPLRVENHPPTGEEFAMGCGICRNINTF